LAKRLIFGRATEGEVFEGRAETLNELLKREEIFCVVDGR
jgi:hypothetical protein